MEVEAAPEQLKDAIEMVPVLVSKIPSAVAPRQESLVTAKPISGDNQPTNTSLSNIPVISVEKTDSLADVIGKFFSVPWGMEKRKLSDVREALQSYGLNYPKQSVAVALLRLAKSSKIRRFKAEDGEYVYTVPGPLPPTESSRPNAVPTDEFATTLMG